jgi:hypothetical protein
MKNARTTIVACAALLCTATLAIAQERELGPGGPGGRQGGPPAGANPERGGPPSRGPAVERGTTPERREPRANIPERREPAGRSAQERRSLEQERNRVEPGQKSDRAVRERERGEQLRERTERNRTPNAGQSAERPAGQGAERYERVRQARVKLSGEQQAHLRSGFETQQGRFTRVTFPVRIGTRIPHTVRVFAIPAAIISFVPDYTYYRYAVLDDGICIIDPDTYEIVDIIDEGPYPAGPRPQIAELHLTPSERALVLDSIAPDFPLAPVRLRLALGAEIPGSVELHSFPDVVLDRVPTLRDFRFIAVEGDVVIVDPRDRSIALVIQR